MFNKLKTSIKELAFIAVENAENVLGSNKGKEKKAMAIESIVSRLPVISPLKKVIAVILSNFIDDAIEFAVQYMNTKKGEV